MRVLRGVLISLSVIGTSLCMPINAAAHTVSVSQTITITAVVAPKRSIVVNDSGQMTKIYSNTNDTITPQVYLNDYPGAARPLTPELLEQYNAVISRQKFLNGVAIPVEPQPADPASVRELLTATVSAMLRPISFM